MTACGATVPAAHRADSTRPGLLPAAASRPLADSGSSAEARLNARISLGVAVLRSSKWFGLLEADRRSSTANVHPLYQHYAELPTYDGNYYALIGSWDRRSRPPEGSCVSPTGP
jgi:hypothetical protein